MCPNKSTVVWAKGAFSYKSLIDTLDIEKAYVICN